MFSNGQGHVIDGGTTKRWWNFKVIRIKLKTLQALYIMS